MLLNNQIESQPLKIKGARNSISMASDASEQMQQTSRSNKLYNLASTTIKKMNKKQTAPNTKQAKRLS